MKKLKKKKKSLKYEYGGDMPKLEGGGNWLQDIKSTGQCTGSNFGGPRCRPGTREYAFAKRARSGEFSKQDGGESTSVAPVDPRRYGRPLTPEEVQQRDKMMSQMASYPASGRLEESASPLDFIGPGTIGNIGKFIKGTSALSREALSGVKGALTKKPYWTYTPEELAQMSADDLATSNAMGTQFRKAIEESGQFTNHTKSAEQFAREQAAKLQYGSRRLEKYLPEKETTEYTTKRLADISKGSEEFWSPISKVEEHFGKLSPYKGKQAFQEITPNKYGGSINKLHEGGEHCTECDKKGSVNFDTATTLIERKNDFLDWLRKTSLEKVKNQLDNEEGFHTMPDGSVMSNSDMDYELRKGGMPRFRKKGTPKLSSYCGGPVNEACITAAINDPDPRVRKLAAFTKRIRGYKYQEGGEPCSEQDIMTPGSPCYNPNQGMLDDPFSQNIPQYDFMQENMGAVGPMATQDSNGQYPYTQGDQNRLQTMSQILPDYMIRNQSDKGAMQSGLDLTKNIANPGLPEFPSQSTKTTTWSPNPLAANLMIAGMEGLTNIFSGDERKNRKKYQQGLTHADQVFQSTQGDRGDYSVNEGYFRPDEMVPVQFSGASGQAKWGGQYKKGGQYYMDDKQASILRAQGYDIEEID